MRLGWDMDLVTTRVPDRKDSKVSRLLALAVVGARSSLCRLAWRRGLVGETQTGILGARVANGPYTGRTKPRILLYRSCQALETVYE